MGVMMIIQGIEANKTGAIIPQTGKTGPMTGMQSIITGIVAGIAGTAFLGFEIYRIYKK